MKTKNFRCAAEAEYLILAYKKAEKLRQLHGLREVFLAPSTGSLGSAHPRLLPDVSNGSAVSMYGAQRVLLLKLKHAQ